jgi:hypothetical protein
MPFYDPDTSLLVLAGKGDTTTRLYEFDSSSGAIYPVSNINAIHIRWNNEPYIFI